MGLPQLKQAMEEITILPPAFRFEDAMALVNDVRAFEAVVAEAENGSAAWRAHFVRNLRDGLSKIEAAKGDLPKAVYAPLLVQLIDAALQAARDALPTFTGSFEDRADLADTIRKVSARSSDAGRWMRKQIRRMDAIQKKQHDAYLLCIGILREYRSRYDDITQDGPNGSDDAAYIASLSDRYSVVNAKLAQ